MNLFLLAGLLLGVISVQVAHGDLPGCIDSDVDPEYEPALRGNESLIRWGGVDTLSLSDGAPVLIGVGQVAIKPGTNFHAWRRAAELKATRAVSEFLSADVSSVSTLLKKTTISNDTDGDAKQRSSRVEKFLNSHIIQRTRMAARISTIGHWCSEDGKYGFVAVVVDPLKR